MAKVISVNIGSGIGLMPDSSKPSSDCHDMMPFLDDCMPKVKVIEVKSGSFPGLALLYNFGTSSSDQWDLFVLQCRLFP